MFWRTPALLNRFHVEDLDLIETRQRERASRIRKMALLKIYSRKGKTSSNERLAPLHRWAEDPCLETISRVLNGLGSQPSHHKR
jgi:transposase